MNSVVLSKSESFWPRFKTRIKPKSKKHSFKLNPSSRYAVEISPATRLTSWKSESSGRIVSISGDGEFVPVILSPVGRSISNERQPTEKEKSLGFEAVEMKVKSRDAQISVKSRQSEVCTAESVPKQISDEEEVNLRQSERRSWVRIAKALLFPMAHGPTVSHRGGHAKDAEMPVIEQPKRQEVRQVNEVADSIPRSIDHPSKFSSTSAEVGSKSCKLLKSIDFHRKLSSHANTPKSFFKGPEIESTPLSSLSPYPELLPRPDMNSTSPNSQPKKLDMSAKRKGTITADAAGEGEGYDMAINLSVLIIIMGCLVVFSDRFLAVACTSFWWFLLPSLLKKYGVSTVADVKIKRSNGSKTEA